MSRTAGTVPVALIDAHHTNVRTDLGDLRELTASIRRNGLLVPLVLERRGERFRIRDGHRRWAAAMVLNLTKVPAIVYDTALDEPDWLLQAVEINEHRRQLDDHERRAGVLRLRAAGWPWTDVAAAFGVTPNTARRWIGEDTPAAATPTPARRPTTRRVSVHAIQNLVDRWRTTSGDLDDLLTSLTHLIEGTNQV